MADKYYVVARDHLGAYGAAYGGMSKKEAEEIIADNEGERLVVIKGREMLVQITLVDEEE